MFSLLLPVILLIITGWLLAHFKLLDSQVVENGLNQILFVIALPGMIFLSIATLPLQLTEAFRYIVGYTAIVGITYVVSYFLSRNKFHLSAVEANFSSLAASISNAVLIGLPILIGLFGLRATVPAALTIIVFILFIIPLFTLIIEYLLHKDTHTLLKTFIKAFKKTMVNPLVIAALLGIIVKIFHVNLPNAFQVYLKYLADATVPCSLLIIGIGLKQVRFDKNYIEILIMTAMNLIFKPIIAILVALWLKLDTFYAISLLVACSLPTAKTLYVISKQYKIYENGTAAIIFLRVLFR